MAFSTSSLTTEAGRSTTSPAAIWLARSDGRRAILPTSDPVLASKQREHEGNYAEHDAEQPPELHRRPAREMRKTDIHSPQTGQERQRHEDGRDHRQDLHDLVQPVADIG